MSSAQRESNELTIRLSRFADYDTLKDENLKMKFELESGVMAERLKAKEEQAINMGNRLKLVEEASSLRVRELKLQLKLVQLDLSLDKYRRVSLTDHPNNHRRFFTFQNSNANRTLPNYQTRSSHQNQTTHSLHRSHQQQHQLPTQTESTTPKIRKILPKNDEFNAEHTFVCPELQEIENCRGAGLSAVGNQRGKVMERRALQANALRASSNSVLLESSSNASVQPLMTSTPMQSFVEVEENGENVEHGSVLSPIKLPLTRKVLSNGDGVNNNNNENRVTTTSFNDLLLKRNQQQQEQQRNVAENILKVTSGQDDVKMKDVAETNAKAGTSAENHSDEIDPVMQQYMNIVLKKREEEKKTKEQREDTDEKHEQPSKKNSPESQEASQKSAGSSVIAARLDHDSAHTESDFDW
ncbi:unnamed protein product [Anisakis simplex]|uniref:Uncharacterized protein n=1 Tax=Anisakis simplex TaxID=6269 RepID=A0A3P6N8A8_ANISI|nr:unnamed protein product [Anisakis simplex]